MRDPDCLFCKIVAGEIPSSKVLEGEDFLAFNDINPQAPVHVLVIPKDHVPSVAEAADPAVFARVMAGVQQVARHLSLKDFRVVVNNGAGAGQTVFHIHFHVLGNRPLQWPPG